MSDATMKAGGGNYESLQHRIRELGREALEGQRELSDVLGDALRELRLMADAVRELEERLRRRGETITRLRGEMGEGWRRPSTERHAAGLEPGPRAGSGADLPVPAGAPVEEERRGLDADLFDTLAPDTPASLEAMLRARIAGALYVGALEAGDRLPSIRELARQTGLNHKAVRRVYRTLERGGLVEVRDRSGIYAAELESPAAGEGLAEVDGWVAGVLNDAVQRGLRLGELAPLLARSTASRGLRCACVESTEDDRFALCHELGRWFGLQSVPVDPEREDVAAALAGVDLVVTTPFHAARVRRALAPGQALVVACLHSAVRRAVEDRLGAGPAWIVCVDPAAAERLRYSLGPAGAGRVRVLALDDPGTEGEAWRGAPAVATLAAWHRLDGGDPPANLVVPAYLSPRTTRQITALLVRLNRAAAAGERAPAALPPQLVPQPAPGTR